MKTENTHEKPVYIYTLSHPLTNEVRYVGKSISPKDRYHQHVNIKFATKRKTKVCNWILKLIKEGLKPKMDIIEICKNDWPERERYWISFYENLCNLTLGGEGVHGRKMSPLHKEIIRKTHLGKKKGYPCITFLNRNHTATSKKAISNKKIGNKCAACPVILYRDNKPYKIFRSMKDGADFSGTSSAQISAFILGTINKTKSGIWKRL